MLMLGFMQAETRKLVGLSSLLGVIILLKFVEIFTQEILFVTYK